MATVKKAAKKAEKSPALVDLTAEEVSSLVRPRQGFEAHVEGILAAKAAFADELSSAKVDAAKVRQSLATVAKLDASIAPLKKQLEMLEETRLLLASNAWTDVLEIYGVAQVVAKKNAKVAKAIEPFAKFMSVGTKKKGAAEKK